MSQTLGPPRSGPRTDPEIRAALDFLAGYVTGLAQRRRGPRTELRLVAQHLAARRGLDGRERPAPIAEPHPGA